MTKRQKEETAKYCMGVSNLCLGSLVLNAFSELSIIARILMIIGGLTLAAAFYILGIRIFKEVR